MLALLLLSATPFSNSEQTKVPFLWPEDRPCALYGNAACHPTNPALGAFQEIVRLQTPSNCSTARILFNKAPFRRAGIGSRFSYYKACLALAVMEGRTYVDHACRRAGDCVPRFLQPWSTCNPVDIEAAQAQGLVRTIKSYGPCIPRFLLRSPPIPPVLCPQGQSGFQCLFWPRP